MGSQFPADKCTNIKKIGNPVAHNTRKWAQGAWMKDPLEIMGAETIFVMEGYSGMNVLEEYENMNKLKAGLARKKYKLPYNWDGTGAVVYGQHLYYNRWTIHLFHIRKQAKYTFIKKNENDSFLNLLLFAELVSGIWPS